MFALSDAAAVIVAACAVLVVAAIAIAVMARRGRRVHVSIDVENGRGEHHDGNAKLDPDH